MAPGAIAYTWLGYAGREALAGDASATRYGLLALGLLAAIAFLPRLVKRLRGGAEPRWIETSELANGLGSGGATIIDVCSPAEFTGPLGHIETALNIPLGELPERLTEINAHKNKPVIVVCKTDKRSASAAILLTAGGFSDVRVLRGGMERWKRDGLAVAGNSTLDRV
jgi:rhodanese-related sulfurtransferase